MGKHEKGRHFFDGEMCALRATERHSGVPTAPIIHPQSNFELFSRGVVLRMATRPSKSELLKIFFAGKGKGEKKGGFGIEILLFFSPVKRHKHKVSRSQCTHRDTIRIILSTGKAFLGTCNPIHPSIHHVKKLSLCSIQYLINRECT